jgi:hypothetical protein
VKRKDKFPPDGILKPNGCLFYFIWLAMPKPRAILHVGFAETVAIRGCHLVRNRLVLAENKKLGMRRDLVSETQQSGRGTRSERSVYETIKEAVEQQVNRTTDIERTTWV